MAVKQQPEQKVQQIFERYLKFKQKTKDQSNELRYYRNRVKDLTESRDSWKAKAMAMRRQLDSNRMRGGGDRQPARHHYSSKVIELCLKLYLLCHCSLRGVVRVLDLLYGGRKPCKSTISNWLRKSGYYVYSESSPKGPSDDYALILDESMVIGQQRLVFAQKISAQRTQARPLKISDVLGSALAVRATWDAKAVGAFLDKVKRRFGHGLCYVICDGDSKLSKALRDAGILRICDVGHEISRLLEKNYKKAPDFIAFNEDLTQIKFKQIMKPQAYLLPPKARVVARFMNLWPSVKWAKKLLHALPSLSKAEQQIFDFLHQHRQLIDELFRLFQLINPLLESIKSKGLSKKELLSIDQHLAQAEQQELCERPQAVIASIRTYLRGETNKLPDEVSVFHASSDVLESSFGIWKNKQSPNKLNGVTPLVLLQALLTKVDKEKKTLNFDVTQAMEKVSLAQIETWAKKNLVPNQVKRRIKTLKLCGNFL